MTSRILWAAMLVFGLAACRDSGHPEGAQMLSGGGGKCVATIDGHVITEAEATQFAATHDDPTIDALAARELLARRAISEGVDVEFARKRAMVDAFLVDEIEGKLTADDVSESALAEAREKVTAELNTPGGYEAVAVRIFAAELRRAPPERHKELLDTVMSTAARLHEAVPQTDGLTAVTSLDLSWVDPAVTVRVFPVRIVDAEVTTPTKGWSRAPRLSAALSEVADGGRTPIFVTKNSPVFAVRKSRVEPHVTDPMTLERAAMTRALAGARTQKVEQLLSKLREDGVVVPHTDVFQEEM